MADFNVYPSLQLQNPDILGSYLKGALGGQQIQMGQMDVAAKRLAMPYLPEQLAQEAQMRGLNLEQAKLALDWNAMINEAAGNELAGETSAPSAGRTGGIENGPQGAPPAPGSTLGGGGYSSITPSDATVGIAQGLGHQFSPDLQRLMSMKEGKYGPETESAIFKDQMERRKLVLQPAVNAADSIVQSQDPGLVINQNPSLRALWTRAGNKEDPARLPPDEVRQRVAAFRDQLLATANQPGEGMPTTYQNIPGAYGQAFQIVASGKDVGKVTEVAGQKLPGYTLQASHDLATGRESVTPLVTQPGGAAAPSTLFGGRGGAALSYPPGPSAPRAPSGTPGGVGSQAGPSFDLGYKKPEAAEEDAARNLDYMYQGHQTLMQHESKGQIPSLAARTLLIQAATSHDESISKTFLSKLAEQKGLSAADKQYMAAAFPVLQTMQRTLSQRMSPIAVNAMITSAIPSGQDDLAQAQQNRIAMMRGLLGESGNAWREPQYQNTLGPLGESLRSSGNPPPQPAPAAAIAHLKAHPELAPAFKQKYGYLPSGQ